MRIPIKPLSVNDAWIGRTRKTAKFKKYQGDVVLLLKPLDVPEGPLRLEVEWGMSSMGGDVDNPLKPFVDCLEAKYGFNDNRIHELIARKRKVPKGEEYIEFSLVGV